MARKKKTISSYVRRTVIIRDQGKCRYCGKQGDFKVYSPNGWVWMEYELDHVIPEFLGGKSTVDNIVVACRKCNRSKGHKTIQEWGMPLILA